MKTKEDLLVKMLNTTGAKNIAKVVDEAEGIFNVNWKPYGGNISNRSLVNAQQSEPNGALIELLTNSMDAITERRMFELGLTKKSPNLPSVAEICNEFFAGDKVAMNKYATVRIIAEGDSVWEKGEYPDIIVADNGTGQTPSNFEKTLLSLSSGVRNKHNVSCMIGAYNMGSTGSFSYCGNGGSSAYKLIVSKRHADMNDGTPKEDLEKIGFTIIRETRVPGEDYIEYLTIDDEIPYITSDISNKITKSYYVQVDEPCRNDANRFDNKKGTSKAKFLDKGGTLIKLYTYQTTAPGVFDSKIAVELNTALYAPVYNVFCCDSRSGYSRERRNTTVLGNYNRFSKGGSLWDLVKLKKDIKITAMLDGVKADVPVTVYVLDKNKAGKKCKGDVRHFNKKGIIFTYNGQVQHSLGEAFVTSQKYLGFASLKNVLQVVVDCTDLNKNKTFHSSREKFLNNQYTRDLEKAIVDTLKIDTDLERLNEEYTTVYSGTMDDDTSRILSEYYADNKDIETILAMSSHKSTIKAKKAKSSTISSPKATKSTTSSTSGKIKKTKVALSKEGFRVQLANITSSFFTDKSERIIIDITNKNKTSIKEQIIISDSSDDDKIVGESLFHYSHIFEGNNMFISLSPLKRCAKGDTYLIHVRSESIHPAFRVEKLIEATVEVKTIASPYTVLYAYEDEEKVDALGGESAGVISWNKITDNDDWTLKKEDQNVILKSSSKDSSKLEVVIINMDSKISKTLVKHFTSRTRYNVDDIMDAYKAMLLNDSLYMYPTYTEMNPEISADDVVKMLCNDKYHRKLTAGIDERLHSKYSRS